MRICYIPPVVATVTNVVEAEAVNLMDILISLANGDTKLLETAISNAINNTLVIPFVTAVTKGWLVFVEVSGYITLFIALAGVMSYIGGVKKGKDVAITCGVIHIIIQLINYFIMRC